MTQRQVLLVTHPTRKDSQAAAAQLAQKVSTSVEFLSLSPDIPGVRQIPLTELSRSVELAVVFGGDGTILRAAEIVSGKGIPILGVNLGHVGFLAQLDKPSMDRLATIIQEREFTTEDRLVVAYEVNRNGTVVADGFALNEVVVESPKPEMVELFVHVDDRPLSRWGCDGVLIATPTGSTAYAFSAGGPVVWPAVEAMVLLPLAAHALFSRPMVIATTSTIGIDVESPIAVLAADGYRRIDLLEGDRVKIQASAERIQLAHIDQSLFTDRLVAKFQLPVEGWRGK
ncbi:MAG: NAD kinase [Candidatus Nanopelagicaceae bacterium]|jgi:NAD+ kinase